MKLRMKEWRYLKYKNHTLNMICGFTLQDGSNLLQNYVYRVLFNCFHIHNKDVDFVNFFYFSYK